MNTPSRKPFLISTALIDLGIRAEQSIVRHERKCLLSALSILGLSAIYDACTKPLWFDEFFTLFVSRLPSLKEMLRAVPADSQPPMQDLVTHLSLRFLGESEFALRLPETLAYLAAGALTYRIARKHGTAVQALFAVLLLLGATVNSIQECTARPYGLLVAFTALTFACWQSAASREAHRTLALCGVTVGLAGAILSHHFGVIHTGVFLAAGEAMRLIQRRKFDVWMLIAILLGTSTLSITYPMARQSHIVLGYAHIHSSGFWAQPTIRDLFFYLWMVALPPLCFVGIFSFLPWSKKIDAGSDATIPPVPAYEWAAAGSLSLLLPGLVITAAFGYGYFIQRYVVSTSLGLALLVSWKLPRLRNLRLGAQPLLALSSTCSVVLTTVALILGELHLPVTSHPGAGAVSTVLLNAPGYLPIIVGDAQEYPPDWWYSTPSIKARLLYLFDVPYALKQSDFIPELSLVAGKPYTPLPLSGFAAFISNHPHFLLFYSGVPRRNWIAPRLVSLGWHLNPIGKSGEDVLYQVDSP